MNQFKCLIFLFVPMLILGQNKPLKINIVSVNSVDSIAEERKFTIHYSVANTTNDKVSFFLKPENFFPAHSNAMGTGIFYKLFQGKEELIINNVFLNKKFKNIEGFPDFSKIIDEKEREEATQKFIENYMKRETDSMLKLLSNGKTEPEILKNRISQSIINAIYSLEPNETKNYTTVWYWDKERYFKRDEFEYYLNEKGTFYLQFYLFLMKEQYEEKLTITDYESLMKIPNFVKGVYQSEKVEINLKDKMVVFH